MAGGDDNGTGAKGQWWRVALRWLVRGLGVALFVGAVVAVGPANIWQGLRKANIWPLIPAFVLAVLLTSGWMLLLLIPVLIIIQRGVVEREEAYLTRKFGDVYRRYQARVPPWL